MGNALVVEDDWGLKAVVCRKVQKGKGRSGEQQQEGGPEKNQTAGQQDGPGGNRLGCSSKAATPQTPYTLTTFARDTSATASGWLW